MKKKTLGGLIGFGVLIAVFIGFGIMQIITIQQRPAKLIEAVRAGRVDEVRALLQAGASPNSRDEHGVLVLKLALIYDVRPDVVSELVDAGAWLQFGVDYGGSALIVAAGSYYDPGMISYFLASGADIDEKDFDGYCALEWAVRNNENPMVAIELIKLGADVHSRPVMHGVHDIEVLHALLDAGADVNAQSKMGFTALMIACEADSPDPKIVKALLDAGSEIDTQSNRGWTALMSAACSTTNPEILEVMLRAGADAKLTNGSGETALGIGKENSDLEGTQAILMLEEASR